MLLFKGPLQEGPLLFSQRQEWRLKMARNELLRSICDALKIDDATTIELFGHVGRPVGLSTVTALKMSEDQDDYIPCSDPVMGFFLDGLIIHSRGRREGQLSPADKPPAALTNNAILKKLRIALDLKEDDLIGILKLAGVAISSHELTALFRKPGHKHYKECNDTFLRDFVRGIALRQKA
jgi:uncharacterized protein YehS (DUF1456 family)